MSEELRAIKKWLQLARYIQKNRVSQSLAHSFVRLAQNSKYNLVEERFEFLTSHPQITELRMKNFESCMGLSFERAHRRYEYEVKYYWWPRVEMGIGFDEAVVKLKVKKGREIHEGYIS